jgi:hypothetical protein
VKKIFTCIFCFVLNAVFLAADMMTVSGVLNSTVKLGSDADGDFIYGLEEYANIRLRSRIGDKATFYGAFNCIATSGMTAQALAASGGIGTQTQNYAALLELERLYVHLVNEKTGLDAGLMRLAFGYGNVFSPSDFFNPRNPLYPDARPRAILGGLFSFYPDDDSNLRTFAAAPFNPFSMEGDGFRIGISGERHFKNMSVQGLYAFESPQDESGGAAVGIHHLGASAKGDAFVGLWVDVLYSLNPAFHREKRWQELSASAGFDYSFVGAHLYFLCEYLFNGAYSITAASDENPSGYHNSHYLYGMARYSVSDFTSVSLSALFAVGDLSLTPIVSFDTDIFQGMRLTLTAQAPLDRSVFSSDSFGHGELGPVQSGMNFLFTIKGELRF